MESVTQRLLPCKLTDAERLSRGSDLSQQLDELDIITTRLDAARRDAKEKSGGITAEIRRLRDAIRTGTEERTVECVWSIDWVTRTKHLHRIYTDEIIESRELSSAELQRDLPLDPPAPPLDLPDAGKSTNPPHIAGAIGVDPDVQDADFEPIEPETPRDVCEDWCLRHWVVDPTRQRQTAVSEIRGQWLIYSRARGLTEQEVASVNPATVALEIMTGAERYAGTRKMNIYRVTPEG